MKCSPSLPSTQKLNRSASSLGYCWYWNRFQLISLRSALIRKTLISFYQWHAQVTVERFFMLLPSGWIQAAMSDMFNDRLEPGRKGKLTCKAYENCSVLFNLKQSFRLPRRRMQNRNAKWRFHPIILSSCVHIQLSVPLLEVLLKVQVYWEPITQPELYFGTLFI